ncbi:hypothetical protein BDR03DRAFT_808121, partial [Suillus americanus]
IVLAHDQEDSHPYWYARVIGIFHANIRYTRQGQRPTIKCVDFLWVRWFARHITAPTGWAAKRLPRVGFYDGNDESAFGFLDPDLVVRGVQLIPAFRHLCTTALLGPSIARQAADNDKDWDWYCVNMFIDRDMFMRFRGGAVGHKST